MDPASRAWRFDRSAGGGGSILRPAFRTARPDPNRFFRQRSARFHRARSSGRPSSGLILFSPRQSAATRAFGPASVLAHGLDGDEKKKDPDDENPNKASA